MSACRDTKGDEVISSLLKLHSKMKKLEDRGRKAKHSPNLLQDIAYAEAQCMLLEDQLKYARQLLALAPVLSHISKTSEKFPSSNKDDVSSETEAETSMQENMIDPKFRKIEPLNRRTFDKRTYYAPVRRQRTRSCSEADFKSGNNAPFLLSKSTAPSHSLPGNIQNLIALLKRHHPGLCGFDSRRLQPVTLNNNAVKSKTTGRSYSDLDLSKKYHDETEQELLDLIYQGTNGIKKSQGSSSSDKKRYVNQGRPSSARHSNENIIHSSDRKNRYYRKGTFDVRSGSPRPASLSSLDYKNNCNKVLLSEVKKLQAMLKTNI